MGEAELEEFYSIPNFQPPEIITPENFPHLLEELKEPTATTRKDGPTDNDEDVILYQDTHGVLIQPKSTARAAQLHALQEEYELNVPQAFARPAYKWVYSPRFPSGLKSYPQVIYNSRGEQKILPRQFSCLRYITKTDPVPGRLGIAYDRCYE